MESMPQKSEIALSISEIVKLGAADTLFYGRTFFPNALRQSSPPMHREIVNLVEHPDHRHAAVKVFRGGAKTTLLRVITSKRIAYGLSRTILFVSETQDHSIKTTRWLKKQIVHNTRWAQTHGLAPAIDETTGRPSKWTDEIFVVHNSVLNIDITVIALGITGQVRGVNIDDFRPDFIVVDDPCDEENTATPESREKINKLFFGALEKSLAPASENPFAKMVLLQTPLARDDLIENAMKDPQWASASFSCFDERGESRWPERWSTETLLADKQAHIARNQLSLWLREMEVKVVSQELATFKLEWLQYWEEIPERGINILAVDPTPPPKDAQQQTSNAKLDDSCVLAIRVYRSKIYVLDYYVTKSPSPDELVNKIFEFVSRYNPIQVGFESILFARTTKHLLEKEMLSRRQYFHVEPIEDPRKKRVRITQQLTNRAANRLIYVNASQTQLIEQFGSYPDVSHDDVLDALSIAIMVLDGLGATVLDGEFWHEIDEIMDDEKDVKRLGNWRADV